VLEKHGIVSALSAGSRRRYLLATGGEHGHVALCLNCGQSIKVETEEQGCPLRPEISRVFEHHGFRAVSHSVVLYGYCHSCIEEHPDDICNGEDHY
jgi:Fe2+ or Zn2+ uptake regulation protein